MEYLIQSSIGQTVLESLNSNCFFRCKKQYSQSNNWNVQQCPEGKGWCCSQIIGPKNYKAKVIIPRRIKRQCTKTYFDAFIDIINSSHELIAKLQDNSSANPIVSPQKNISEIIVHNSKNIHTNIVSKFQTIFPNLLDSDVDDKKNYILQELKSNSNSSDIARELLSIWKSLTQQTFQYSVADYIEAATLDISDFVRQQIYTIVKMAFFQYEDDFKEKKIIVHFSPFTEEVCCHFDTVKAAFCALFENCIKYCKKDSRIDISFLKENDKIITTISMLSRIIKDSDLSFIFDYGKRGARVQDLPGKGVGLWMMKKMMQLNFGDVSTKPSENRFHIDGNEYGNNSFTFELNSNKRQILEKIHY